MKALLKHSTTQIFAVALIATCLNFSAFADPQPGEVDFGKFSGLSKEASFVEINLRRTLICLAAKIVEDQQPEAARLLRSIQLVRVNVIGLTDRNRGDMEKRLATFRGQLNQQGWERIATAQEKKGEDVGVYVKTHGDDSMEGLVVTVLDGNKREVVFVNLVGNIKPEQIATVGKALELDPLRKAAKSIQK